MTPFRLQPIEVLDWYDGLVLAIVRTSWLSGVFLASLLSWNQDRKQRVYALVPFDEANIPEIRSASADWSSLLSLLRRRCSEITGDAVLVLWDESADAGVAEASTPIENVSGEMMGQIDDALKSERQRWFELVERGPASDSRVKSPALW